jgi:hypothetical protein
VEDPVDFLVRELGTSLGDVLFQITQKMPERDQPSREVGGEILSQLGFPRPVTPRGARWALHELRIGRDTVLLSPTGALPGVVVKGASTLEHVVLVLLRFVCKQAFRQPPEKLFREERPNLLGDKQLLSRCSLGKLLEMLEHLAKKLEAATDPWAAALRDEKLRGRRLTPKGTTEIAGLRNRFAHSDKEAPPDDAVDLALEFFDRAIAFVEYLSSEDGRIFPHVMMIESITFDRWGRRTVRAIDEERKPELIFTKEELRPGHVYYMYPMTNPMRVDPIIVPASDVESG